MPPPYDVDVELQQRTDERNDSANQTGYCVHVMCHYIVDAFVAELKKADYFEE